MESLRRTIQHHVHALVGTGGGGRRRAPPTEPGFFEPRAICRRVHGDFSSMMIGGITALLLQMLHPAALAGVWDHSDFRRDSRGRLRRTARFISVTTYGPKSEALQMIGRIRAIHERVQGTLPDGSPYRASDPDLLTWVHVAEVSSFLQAYLRYRDPLLAASAQDRYFAETARVAYALGATAVPETRAAVDTYLEAMRPALRCDDRTREVAAVLLEQPAGGPSGAFQALAIEAAIDLLPPWAAHLHGLSIPPARRPLVRAGAAGAATLLRWAMR